MLFDKTLLWGVLGLLSASLLYSDTLVASTGQYIPSDNWAVDGLNGTLDVSGQLVESPCILGGESEEQEISLGEIPLWQLSKYGDVSEPVMIHLSLEDCGVGEVITRAPEHGNNAVYLPQQSVVMARLLAETEPEDQHLIHLSGSAKGMALLLEDNNQHRLLAGERSWPQILSPGHNDLHFQAQLIRLSREVKTGSFRATVYLGLEYH
ncbi:fimbrial protein [Enterobacter asburiae]